MRNIIIILCLYIGITPVVAQNKILEKRISVTLESVPMEDAIEEIAEVAGVFVSYSSMLFLECAPVTINVKRETLLTILNEILKPYRITYTVHAGQIIFHPKKTMVIKDYTLKGIISDGQTGIPISYATLQIKGKPKGVVADNNGFFEFTITELELPDSLMASRLGYERKVFQARSMLSDTTINITLNEKPVTIEPVITVATRLRKKTKQVGNRHWFNKGSLYLDTHGQQIALHIDNKKKLVGYIQKVSYYLSDKGNVEAPFRVRILEKDTVSNAPGKDLIPEILVVQPPGDTYGWFDVDLSAYRIAVPVNGFYVAMQGIFPNDYTFYAGDSDFFEIGKRQPGHNDDFAPKSIHYGQRIGYSGKEGRNTWHYSLSHQWFQMEGHNYNVKISAEIINYK